MNESKRFFVAAAALGGALAFGVNDALAGIKCWTNDEGIRECGNVVPPEFAQQGHKEINKQGITIKEMQPAKSPEEIAEERRRAEEREAAARTAVEQASKDRVLLDTFTTTDDIMLARDGKLQAIESRIMHTQKRVEKLHGELEKLRTEAAGMERSGKPVPEQLQVEIIETERHIQDNLGFIESRRQEQAELRAQFDADLARYRALKAEGR